MADAGISLSVPSFLTGGGEMGNVIGAHDWSFSPLGPLSTWPQSLRSIVGLLLSSKSPMFVAWGKDLVFLYNDPYAEFIGAKHPSALGSRLQDVWSEIWPDISPLIGAAMTGEATYRENQPLIKQRKGSDEQTWCNFSCSPVRDETGSVAGIFCLVAETTAVVLAERRQRFRTDLNEALRPLSDPAKITARATRTLCDFLRASRVHYGEIEADREHAVVPGDHPFGVPNRAGHYRLADFPLLTAECRGGRAFVVSDTAVDPRLDAPERALYASLPVAGLAVMPLLKDGQLAAILAVHYSQPHVWTSHELALVQDTADRIWDAIERARAETTVRESEARFRLMVDALPQIVWVADATGRMEFFNQQFSRYTGAPFRPMEPGEVAAQFMHQDDGASVVSRFKVARETGQPFQVEHRIRSSSGEYHWFHVRAEPYRHPATGEIIRWVGTSVDINDRKLAEEALRALNAELERKVLERTLERGLMWQHSPDLFSVIDLAKGTFDATNPAWAATLGWSQSEIDGVAFAHFIHPDDLAASSAAFEQARCGRDVLGWVNRYRHKDGSWRWLSWFAVPEGGKLYSSTRDVTAEKARAAELAERTAERDVLWRNSQDLLLIARFDATIMAVNPAWASVLGWRESELIGSNFLDLVHPDDHAATVANATRLSAEGRSTMQFENRYRSKSGAWVCLSWAGTSHEGLFHAVARDVTKEKDAAARLEAAQEVLRQSQKMEAMGQLTGGVAHDFNNLLTPILGTLDMLQRRGIGNEREQRMIAGALQSTERAAILVQRLLAFARRQPLRPIPIDVAKLVAGMAELISSTTGPQIKVVVEAPDGLPPAKADSNQLEMALLNLIVNARDAMTEGGTLRISTDAETVTDGHRSKLPLGVYICVSVADTGGGMDEATLARATEPFFSTKGIGKGTGLGLSMVHGLALQLDGALIIQSRPGVGTNVELWLPRTSEAASRVDETPPTATAGPTGRGTALLVDDEELVRLSTADMLNDLGYAVIEAASAEEAIALLANGEHFDLLVTDHLMPGMNGTDLAREIRAAKPGIPVLLVSGYADLDSIEADLPRLTKPFRKDELALILTQLSAAP